MLAPEYLRRFPNSTVKIFQEMEEKVIADVVKQFEKNLKLSATSDYQINQLIKAGFDLKEIEAEIAVGVNQGLAEVEKALKQSTYFDYQNEVELYARGNKRLPLKMGPPMQRQLAAVMQKTKMTMINMTGSLGIMTDSGAKDITDFYQERLDAGFVQMALGGRNREDIVRETVRDIAKSGVRTVNWDTGHTDSLDVAVRRALRTGRTQLSGEMSEKNAIMMGQDLMEITSHWGARASHADWQGQIVSRSGAPGYLSLMDIGYGDVGGFKGVNCRHDWYPFFEGIDSPIEVPPEPEPFEYGEKEYTYYEATQEQRRMEREIRKTRLELEGFKAAGLTEDAKLAQIKMRMQNAEYNKFSQAAGIRAKTERTRGYIGSSSDNGGILGYGSQGREGIKDAMKENLAKEQKFSHVISNGKDLSGKSFYEEMLSEFEHDIEDIINKQGYDGKPRVVSPEEFEKILEESKFYSERSYAADSEELLKQYKDELYGGKFYVDCSTGGAQYGQGMYVASVDDYTNLSGMNGIKEEMEHYVGLGGKRGYNYSRVEAITMDPSTKFFEIPEGMWSQTYINHKYDLNLYGKVIDDMTTREKGLYKKYQSAFSEWVEGYESAYTRNEPDGVKKIRAAKKKLDTAEFNINNSPINYHIEKAKAIPIEDAEAWEFLRKDQGTLVAEMGYDAINARGHGESGTYTVILNRTKVIIKDGGVKY